MDNDKLDELEQLKRDTGIPHLPTQLTYECRMAIAGEGPRAYEWSDKPHRVVYDLCREIEAAAARRPALPDREAVAKAYSDGFKDGCGSGCGCSDGQTADPEDVQEYLDDVFALSPAQAERDTGPHICRECWGLGGDDVRGDSGKCERCGRRGAMLSAAPKEPDHG